MSDFAANNGPILRPIKESTVVREMTSRYFQDIDTYAEADVVVVGAGPSGLVAAYELSKIPNIKIALIEASVAPGGGAWVGGQLFSAMVIRKPAHLILDELQIPYDDKEDYVVLSHAATFTSTILSAVLRSGRVKLFNAVAVEDLLVRGQGTADVRVGGVVTNWAVVTKAHGTQSCMDPNIMEAKLVISSCGHDGPFGATGVRRLKELGLVDEVKGIGALDINASEDAIFRGTREIVPGMIITGMEVSTLLGTPRMGPTFGGMILSGQRAAVLAIRALGINTVLSKNAGLTPLAYTARAEAEQVVAK